MSEKAVDKFFYFLEQKKLSKLNPAAFTQSEIMSYAVQNNFHFSREALTSKMRKISETDDELLNSVEKAWKELM